MKLSDFNVRIPESDQTMTITNFLEGVALGNYDENLHVYLACRLFKCRYTTKAKDILSTLTELPEPERGVVGFVCLRNKDGREYKEHMVGDYQSGLQIDGYTINVDMKGKYGCYLYISKSFREIGEDGNSTVYTNVLVNIHIPLKGMAFMIKLFKAHLKNCCMGFIDKL